MKKRRVEARVLFKNLTEVQFTFKVGVKKSYDMRLGRETSFRYFEGLKKFKVIESKNQQITRDLEDEVQRHAKEVSMHLMESFPKLLNKYKWQ